MVDLDPCHDDACNGNYCVSDSVGGIACNCSTTGFTGPTCITGIFCVKVLLGAIDEKIAQNSQNYQIPKSFHILA